MKPAAAEASPQILLLPSRVLPPFFLHPAPSRAPFPSLRGALRYIARSGRCRTYDPKRMGLEMEAAPAAASEQGVVEIYPLSRYYFGAKDAAAAVPRGVETAADRALRLKASFAAHGLRTSVHGVLLVELFDHPHVLLLQLRNSSFVLPGGRLRPGEQDVQGLKRKLSSKLSIVDDAEDNDEWQIGECIGMWWRSEFEAIPFPYMPPNFRAPKECIKLFLIRLPMSRRFVVPRNMKLLAVPLSQIHNNAQVYGPIISGIPNLLSKFSLNVISD